jgi:hypothetical protein
MMYERRFRSPRSRGCDLHMCVRRRRYTTQPRVAAPRGAPWVKDAVLRPPYAEGVIQHSPGSPRFAAHPGSKTRSPDLRTPKALYNTAQSRRAARRTLGQRRGPQISVRRRRYTTQPRVAAPRGAPWVTCNHPHTNPEGVSRMIGLTFNPKRNVRQCRDRICCTDDGTRPEMILSGDVSLGSRCIS